MAIVAAAGIAAAATIFSASKSANASQAAASAQREAAQLQTQVARELHEHWKAYYRQCDINTITEVCAVPPYAPQYELWEGRSRLEVLRSFARARDALRKCQDVYCVGRAAQQCNYIAGIEAVALVDSVNFGYRFEESQRINLNQLRLQNIYNQLGLGRNLLNQSTAASQMASAAAYRLGAQAGQASNGWLQAAGWLAGEQGQRALTGAINRIMGPTPSFQRSVAPGETGSFDTGGSSGTGISEPGPSPDVSTGFGGGMQIAPEGGTVFDSAAQGGGI